MKGFSRKNQLLSLCGLNCGLCPMHLDGHCPGCGGGFGNQSCKVAKCSLEYNNIEYCYECELYPCDKYEHMDDFDSFITHKNRKKDFERVQKIGIDSYIMEQKEKIKILKFLLADYNDGRRKTLFCVAVNLLDLQELQKIERQIRNDVTLTTATHKQRVLYVAGLLQGVAKKNGIELKLYKKDKK